MWLCVCAHARACVIFVCILDSTILCICLYTEFTPYTGLLCIGYVCMLDSEYMLDSYHILDLSAHLVRIFTGFVCVLNSVVGYIGFVCMLESSNILDSVVRWIVYTLDSCMYWICLYVWDSCIWFVVILYWSHTIYWICLYIGFTLYIGLLCILNSDCIVCRLLNSSGTGFLLPESVSSIGCLLVSYIYWYFTVRYYNS